MIEEADCRQLRPPIPHHYNKQTKQNGLRRIQGGACKQQIQRGSSERRGEERIYGSDPCSRRLAELRHEMVGDVYDEAAKKIEAVQRGIEARKELEQQKKSAVVMQSLYRWRQGAPPIGAASRLGRLSRRTRRS